MNVKLRFGALCIIFVLFASSCLKETIDDLNNIKSVGASPLVSVPFINGNIGVKDIYNNYSKQGVMHEASDGFLTFVFSGRDSLQPKQLIQVPEINLDYELKMDPGAAAQFQAIGKFSNSFSNYAIFKTSNKERLKGYRIRKGNFTVRVRSEFNHSATLVFFYPTITRNGIPLTDTVTFNAPDSTTRILTLDGYDVDLSDGGISYNVIPYMFEVNLTRNPAHPVSTDEKVTIHETFHVDEYAFIKGYLGRFDILNFSQKQRLDIFDKQVEGNVFIKDPRLIINIENGLGLPITGKISNLRVINPHGVVIPVRVDQFKDTFSFPYPSGVGDIAKGQYVVDRSNSNIDSIISTAPQYMLYDLAFIANYKEEVHEDNYVIWDNSFKALADIEVPLEMKVLHYTVESRSDFSPPAQDSSLTVEWVKLKTHSENKLPFNSLLQVYFVNAVANTDSFTIIDSLYSLPINLPGARVDASGNIIGVGVYENEVEMTKEHFDRIKKCDQYVMRVNTQTSTIGGNSPFVKIYGNQLINLKVGADAKFRFSQKL